MSRDPRRKKAPTAVSLGDGRSPLESLSHAAAHTTVNAVPAEVQDRLRDLVVDTWAVASWGSRRTELASLSDLVGGNAGVGASTVFGAGVARPAPVACALNGAAAAADQLQDGHRLARGHPGSHVVLAVVALAEEMGASTEAMLSAILAGYEVGARLGMAMRGTPSGVHDIGTWGALAACVGTAHLLRPGDPSVIRGAIELGASALLLTDATTVFGGHPGGHAYLGASVAHGLWLGQVAAAGLAAAPGALERFFALHAAADWAGVPEVTGGRWAEFEVLRGYIKLHPTCAHLHGVLDALAVAMAQLGAEPMEAISPDQVERVRVRTYAAAAAFAAPARNELEARFSIPTSVALALLHGGLRDDALKDEAVNAPEVRALTGRVEVTVDQELDAGYPEGRPSIVEVLLRNGSAARARSSRPRGDSDGAASRNAFHDKAERLLRARFTGGADELLDVLSHWPAHRTPREIGEAFRRAARVSTGTVR